jgi:hypothetical protein
MKIKNVFALQTCIPVDRVSVLRDLFSKEIGIFSRNPVLYCLVLQVPASLAQRLEEIVARTSEIFLGEEVAQASRLEVSRATYLHEDIKIKI